MYKEGGSRNLANSLASRKRELREEPHLLPFLLEPYSHYLLWMSV